MLLALYVCWGSAIPAMKLMVDTVPPVGGAALVFLLAGIVLTCAARGRPRPTRVQMRNLSLAGVLLLVGGQGLAIVALTAVSAGSRGHPCRRDPAVGRAPQSCHRNPGAARVLDAPRSGVRGHRDRRRDRTGQRGRRSRVGGRGVLRRAHPVGRGNPDVVERRASSRSSGRQRGSTAGRRHVATAPRAVARRPRPDSVVQRQPDLGRGSGLPARLRLAGSGSCSTRACSTAHHHRWSAPTPTSPRCLALRSARPCLTSHSGLGHSSVDPSCSEQSHSNCPARRPRRSQNCHPRTDVSRNVDAIGVRPHRSRGAPGILMSGGRAPSGSLDCTSRMVRPRSSPSPTETPSGEPP